MAQLTERATALVLVCGCVCGAPAAGQSGSIAGAVVDSATRAPLPSAVVSALDPTGTTPASAVTDARGRFRLPGLGAAQVTLVVTRFGYASRRIEILVPADATTIVELALTPQRFVLDPVQVTASRTPETALDAPMAVSVVGRREIQERAAFTPAEYVRNVPGMDFISTGLVQHGFAVRGRNGASQGFLLMMADYRNAALPSLGTNASVLLPFTNEDLERIEVVRGPGAALYGPDAHRGVVHFVSRSPFESQGFAVSLSGGERSVREASARVATAVGSTVAFKVSGDYFRGDDWPLPVAAETLRTDKSARRLGGEARIDWRMDSTTTVVGSVGMAQAINVVVIGGGGPIQAKDWRYTFGQTRLQRAKLLVNASYNVSDAGDSYLLRSGAPIVDHSRQAALQLQNGSDRGSINLLYGLDGRWTDPRTGGTIHGDNEDHDQVVEVGGYLQGRAVVSPRFDVVTAVRIDRNDRLDDLSVSPRAGVVFRPDPGHAVRLTYNRAFSSPDPAQLFQDFVTRSLVGLQYDVRLSSIPRSGYSFRRDCGGLCMRSPYRAVGAPDYLPVDATLTWDSVKAIMGRRNIDISDIPAPSSTQVASVFGSLTSPTAGLSFDRVTAAEVLDFAPLQRSFTQTLELGYTGVIAGSLSLTADAYLSRVQSPFGTAFAATPNVFHDSTTLALYLAAFRSATEAAQLAGTISRVPVGTVSPRETTHPYDILFLQHQGGAYTVWGMDVGATAAVASRWEVSGTYSFFSENVLNDVAVVGTVFLNVPRHKGVFTLGYRNGTGLAAQLQGRAVGAFPVRTAAVTADMPAYALLDARVSYAVTRGSGIGLSVDAYNVLNHRHREVGGGGLLGRMVVSRLQLRF